MSGQLPEVIERYTAWTKWADENREPGVLLWPYDGCTADAVKIASSVARGQCEGPAFENLKERLSRLEEHWRSMASHYVDGDIRGPLTSELADALRAAIDRKGRV